MLPLSRFLPTLFRSEMGQEIKKLWEELKSINKTTKAKREGGSEKINGFKEKLDRTMTFWPRDAFERIQNEEDKLFLQSMMGDRTATLGPVNNVLANKENKVLRGRHREEEQRKKEAKRLKEEPNGVVDMTASSEEEEAASQKRLVEDQYVSPSCSRSHNRLVKTGTVGGFTYNFGSCPAIQLQASAVRNKITPPPPDSWTFYIL